MCDCRRCSAPRNGFYPSAIDDVASIYVHALTDRPTRTWTADGRRIPSVAVGGVFAVGERRLDPPQLSEEELRFQHRVVVEIAARVPAILPARFGSLTDEKKLDAIVRERESIIDEAMTLVRGRIQMTLRTAAKFADERGTTAASVARRAAPVSGRQYLESLKSRASPALSARVESAIARASGYVAAERRQRTVAGHVAVYHLLNRMDVDGYLRALGQRRGLTVSGPWPPFAFVPDLWS